MTKSVSVALGFFFITPVLQLPLLTYGPVTLAGSSNCLVIIQEGVTHCLLSCDGYRGLSQGLKFEYAANDVWTGTGIEHLCCLLCPSNIIVPSRHADALTFIFIFLFYFFTWLNNNYFGLLSLVYSLVFPFVFKKCLIWGCNSLYAIPFSSFAFLPNITPCKIQFIAFSFLNFCWNLLLLIFFYWVSLALLRALGEGDAFVSIPPGNRCSWHN